MKQKKWFNFLNP